MRDGIGKALGLMISCFVLGGCPDAIPVVVGLDGGDSSGTGGFGGFGTSSSTGNGGTDGGFFTGKRVFLTDMPVPATQVTTICGLTASNYQLGGTWDSWTSDSVNGSPATRFTKSSEPYRMLDGVLVANDWADLIDGLLVNPIDLPPDYIRASNSEVWTGTLPDGTADLTNGNCVDWTSTNMADTAAVGITSTTDMTWTGVFPQYCNRTNVRVYCFEQ
jgi:hypothetical protein